MGQVVRPPSLVRQLLGLDERLQGVEVHAGGRRWGPQEPWHEVGAVGEPSFQPSWMNYDRHLENPGVIRPHPVRFFRDQRGTVHFNGLPEITLPASDIPTEGGWSTVFVLPPGLRPLMEVQVVTGCTPATTAGDYIKVTIRETGALQVLITGWNASDGWVSLGGLGFPLGI